MGDFYLAVDGDDVGHRLEYYILLNQIEALSDFSGSFESAMTWLVRKLIVEFGAVIVFSGGDNLVARLGSGKPTAEVIDALRSEFSKIAQITLSIGLGGSLREAYLALKLAKVSGKNCVRDFGEFSNE